MSEQVESMGYTWTVHATDHEPIAKLNLQTPCTRTKTDAHVLNWVTEVVWTRYQLYVARTTQIDRRVYPRLVESVTLADCSKQSLLQPKDWGSRRVERWTKLGTTHGCTASTDPLDWKDIKYLRPFFQGLTPLVLGCGEQGNFLPLIDYMTENETPIARLFTEPGDLSA